LELLAYLILTLAYSFRFKSVPLLDVFVIGLLFTLRIVMGATFIDVSLPLWLLTFSIFFFFSLAMAKRHTEIVRAKKVGGDSLQHRGYQVDDWPLTLTIGVGAALGSLIILVLYMVEEAFRVVGYSRPAFLWMITLFLAVWVGRIWLLTHRGQMNDDPVVFALRDRASQAIAVMIAVCFLIAI
jgi:4-hydroxybenzoate polyprenyltransferase